MAALQALLPETGTYYYVFDSTIFRDSSFDFSVNDLATAWRKKSCTIRASWKRTSCLLG